MLFVLAVLAALSFVSARRRPKTSQLNTAALGLYVHNSGLVQEVIRTKTNQLNTAALTFNLGQAPRCVNKPRIRCVCF